MSSPANRSTSTTSAARPRYGEGGRLEYVAPATVTLTRGMAICGVDLGLQKAALANAGLGNPFGDPLAKT